MKRNIFRISLISLISLGLLTARAKDDIIEGEWNDDWGDNPGNVEVKFKVTPKAEFKDLKLHLTAGDPKAKIFWTTETDVMPDDSESWKPYNGPIALDKDCVVSFYGMIDGGVRSDVQTYSFVYDDYLTATPVITTNDEGTQIIMSCATAGAQIRYTLDGSEPTAQSDLYSEPVDINSYIYRARAFADGMFDSNICDYNVNITLTVAAPSAVFENKLLVLSCADSKSTILYTLDTEAATDDAGAWKEYNSPVALTENCLVRFFSRRDGYNDSDVQSFTFVYSNYRAADPTIERNEAGTHIVMETTTEGGQIRYTTDGSEPDELSTLYTEPILIECNGTITAKTFADGLFESKSNRYVISNMAVPDPYVSFTQKHFVLSCLDPKAAIWYTTDMNASVDNMEAWTLYETPISLSENCDLRFFARRDNFNDSDLEHLAVVIADYQLIAPSITRNAQGTHIVMTYTQQGSQIGSVPEDGEGVLMTPNIHYTTDGSEPTLESAIYEAPIRIKEGAIYRAKVFDVNWLDSEISEYIIGSDHLAAPEGKFENFALVLTTTDEGAQIWYTTDPELSVDNVDAWTLYEKPIALTEECVYRFFAGDDDANASDVQTFVFQKADYKVIAPTIERDDEGICIVMETTTEDADIRYTTDGSEPTKESSLYVDPVPITCNGIYRAKAFLEGMYDSDITEFVVSNMAVPVPYASFENKVLTLTCSDPEASIWYTTDDDATPENIEAWTLYTEPVALTQNCTIHFFTRRDNFNDSDIETFVFLRANYQVAIPTIERTEDGNALVMNCETEGAEIRYTTDGSEPTEESTLYTEPVFLTGNYTFRAKAFAEGLFESPLSEYAVVNMAVSNPYSTFENLKLTLGIWDSEAIIWYTTVAGADVADTAEWTIYTEPISLTEDCTVSYFARRVNLLDSEVMTFEFVYADYQAAAPVISLIEGNSHVEIISDIEGAEIRFTLDGTEPSEYSELYTEPIELEYGMNIIHARVFVPGMYASEETVFTYDYTTSGIEGVSVTDGIVFTMQNGVAGFTSSVETQLQVYDMRGVSVAVLDLHPGFNALPDLAPGFYLAAGKKFKL